MPSPTRSAVTGALAAVRRGEPGAMDRLVSLVYDELHDMAHRQLQRRRPGSLNTTALVHEAYLKLADRTRAEWADRKHFLSVAALAMRHVVVDLARKLAAGKREGERWAVLLDEDVLGVTVGVEEILAVDEALSALTALDARQGRIVELRFFGGLTIGETAEVLGVSEMTVKRGWRHARAFLYRALDEQAG